MIINEKNSKILFGDSNNNNNIEKNVCPVFFGCGTEKLSDEDKKGLAESWANLEKIERLRSLIITDHIINLKNQKKEDLSSSKCGEL